MINPDEDGITHINVYSKGATPLGRWLTNFAYSPFVHPVFGPFHSMEGYWYWLATGRIHDVFRIKSGFEAKSLGKTLPRVEDPLFEQLICEGLYAKITQDEDGCLAFRHSTLPLLHYYNYGGKVVLSKGNQWQLDYLDALRGQLRDFTTWW